MHKRVIPAFPPEIKRASVGTAKLLVPPALPVDVHAYFDAIAVWLKVAADRPTRTWIRRHCDYLDPHPHDRPARFDRKYRQRLFIVRPDNQLRRWLANRDDALINYVEFALDWIFATDEERAEMFRYVHRHAVRGHHRGRRQRVGLFRFDKNKVKHQTDDPDEADIRYDATRGARNKLTTYPEEWSRITGQPSCLHHEWRASSAHAVRAAGVNSGKDLVGFDHRAFWTPRLRMVDVDLERIGRLLRNRHDGSRSRTPLIVEDWRGVQVSQDQKWGEALARAVDLGRTGTVQDFIDEWRHRLALDRAMRPIDCEALLP